MSLFCQSNDSLGWYGQIRSATERRPGGGRLLSRAAAATHELLDAFGDRLVEVHLSSIDPGGTHVPLRAADAEAFLPVLERCVGVPWVLEAPAAG